MPDVSPSLETQRRHRLEQLLAHQGRDRQFLADAPMRATRRDALTGIELTVRLTSYRALPLSCIAGMRLSLDGHSLATDQSLLQLQGSSYRVRDFPRLSRVWWFVLDSALWFVPTSNPAALATGGHDVEGELITVEPYMTAGRFAFHATARRRLELQAPSTAAP